MCIAPDAQVFGANSSRRILLKPWSPSKFLILWFILSVTNLNDVLRWADFRPARNFWSRRIKAESKQVITAFQELALKRKWKITESAP